MIQKKELYAILLPFLGGFLLNACISEKAPEPIDCTVNPVVIQNLATTMSTCGVDDGTITITASGGTGDYEYSLDGINFQSDNIFTRLSAGNFMVTVSDLDNCVASSEAIVESNVGMTIEAIVTSDAGCDDGLGELQISVSGGLAPYQYKLEGGVYQADAMFEGLTAGNYTLIAQDNNGCEISTQSDVPTGTGLDLEIFPILQANCAVTGCHNGKNSLPDWTDKSKIIAAASFIKNRTGNKSMPPGDRSITDMEIQLIACWVDDGAQNN